MCQHWDSYQWIVFLLHPKWRETVSFRTAVLVRHQRSNSTSSSSNNSVHGKMSFNMPKKRSMEIFHQNSQSFNLRHRPNAPMSSNRFLKEKVNLFVMNVTKRSTSRARWRDINTNIPVSVENYFQFLMPFLPQTSDLCQDIEHWANVPSLFIEFIE